MRLLFVALLLVAENAPASGAAREPCVWLKTMAAGTEAAAKLRCQAKATSAGAGVSAHCVARAEVKLRAAFGRAERRGGCGTTGDEACLDGAIEAFTAAVVLTVTAPGSVTTTTTTIAGTTSSSTTTPGTPPPTTTSSTTLGRTVSFRTEVQPILATSCALVFCH